MVLLTRGFLLHGSPHSGGRLPSPFTVLFPLAHLEYLRCSCKHPVIIGSQPLFLSSCGSLLCRSFPCFPPPPVLMAPCNPLCLVLSPPCWYLGLPAFPFARLPPSRVCVSILLLVPYSLRAEGISGARVNNLPSCTHNTRRLPSSLLRFPSALSLKRCRPSTRAVQTRAARSRAPPQCACFQDHSRTPSLLPPASSLQALQTVNSGRSNSSGSQQSSSSSRLLKDVQANNGVLRSVVNMKNTVMKISVHNRQQVGADGGGRGEVRGWVDAGASS